VDVEAGAWITLGCLVWLGIGAGLMQWWGDREEWLKSFFSAFPDMRPLAHARPRAFTAMYLVSLFFLAVLWPYSMAPTLASVPARIRMRRIKRRMRRLQDRIDAIEGEHPHRETKEK
jgi:hypothetical protein